MVLTILWILTTTTMEFPMKKTLTMITMEFLI